MSQSTSVPGRHLNKATLYFFGALGGILFGYDLGVISGVLLYLRKVWNLGSVAQGTVGACLAVGAMIGAAVAGRMSDLLGRRGAIMVAATVFALGTLGCTFAPSASFLIVARFLVGIAVGCSSATVPMYLAELAPSRMRGALSSLNQLMIVTGILAAYVVDWALSFSGNWRAMLGAALLPAVVLLVGLPFLPETPRWLVKRGREDEARGVIRSAQGPGDVDRELACIREVIRLDSEQRGRLRDLGARWVRPALLVAMIMAVGQQFSGVNAVNFYAPTMFTDLGFGKSASLAASIILGVVKLAFTAWVIFVVDRWGRKPLLLIGNVSMSLTLLLLGVSVLAFHSSLASGVATLVFLIIYLAGYELGWGAIVWVMMAEIFPLKVRGVGMGVSSVVLWASTFAITFVFPIMNNTLGLAYSAWIFAGIGVVLFALVARFVPETKGRSLEEIELDLRARAHRRGAVSTAPTPTTTAR